MKRASLNHAYRLVWSEIHNAWVAICETGKSRGKSAGVRRLRAALGLLALMGGSGVLADMAHAGQPLPTGGKITAGSGSISQSGSSMTINQSTGSMSINWQGFSIGQGNTVQFVQPGSSSVAVNRVVGSDVSDIQGSLKANGQVFLSNPNGVLFSPTAQVNVGGLVATTRSITQNSDGTYTLSGTSGASVTNQGSINATGGTVAMVAARIENTGSIAATGGNVLMGAGDKVTLDLGGPVKLSVDKGSVNALIEQGGLIQANGGQVLIAARSLGTVTQTVINQTGVIEAQTLSTGKSGEITLLGDMSNGQINVGGTLDASAPSGGNGGHIETDAAQVKIAPDAHITTQAASGTTGDWVIDPTNFTIQAGSGTLQANSIGVDTLEGMLNNTNVTLTTSTAKNGSDLGDIDVQDDVAWSAHTLTLNAAHDIDVNAQMSVGQASTDKAGLVMNAANNINVGTDSGGSGSITAAGTSTVTLNAGKNIDVGTANTAGSIQMNDSSSLALNYGNTKGSASAKAAANTGIAMGIAVDGSGTPSFNGSVDFNSTSQTLKINGVAYTLIGDAQSLQNLDTYTGASSASAAAQAKAVQTQLAGHYALIGDIGDTVTSSIGSAATPFTGVLEGLGHTLTTTTSLFGQIGKTGVAENLGLSGSGSVSSGDPVFGALAEGNYGKINNVWSAASVANADAGGSSLVGGLVGYNYSTGTINNAYVAAAVADTNTQGAVGGVAGRNDGTITTAVATAAASVAGTNDVGGVVGLNYGTLTGASSAVSVTGSGMVGGVVGDNLGTISGAAYMGASVSGVSSVGGLAGSNEGKISGSSADNTASVSGTSQVGGLVGLNDGGTISSSESSGNVWGSDSFSSGSGGLGGLAGVNESANPTGKKVVAGVITGSSSSAVVDSSYLENLDSTTLGGNAVGGLVGENKAGASIVNSSASGSVSGYGVTGMGGLVGFNDGASGSIANGTITNSSATGSVTDTASTTGYYEWVGGLAGQNNGTISGSFATGNVTGSNNSDAYTGTASSGDVNTRVGGLVGGNNGTINNSHAAGNVAGDAKVGGLVGGNSGAVTNDYYAPTAYIDISLSDSTASSAGNVMGSSSVGGLVGSNGSNSSNSSLIGSISNSYATGSVVGTAGAQDVGGLVGLLGAGAVTNVYATGDVAGYDSATYVGGLVGRSNSGVITNAYATGDVGTATATYVGGLVGGNKTMSSTSNGKTTIAYGTITNAYATGDVVGVDRVGGLVGVNDGTITGVYASGNVGDATASPSATRVGGLVGGNDGVISNASAFGDVTGADRVGGLIGSNDANGSISGAGSVSNVYVAGEVTGTGATASTGTHYVGALVGTNWSIPSGVSASQSGLYNTQAVPNGAVATWKNATWNSNTVNQANFAGFNGFDFQSGTESDGTTNTNVSGVANAGGNYATSSYANLVGATGKWTTLAGADGKVLVLDSPTTKKPVWVMINGSTQPFLASEWSTNITNAHQLQLMAMNLAGKYTLANDIDLAAALGSGMWSDEGFAPIGGATYSLTVASTGKLTQTISAVPFTGSFDGQGHTITGLTIQHEDDVADAIDNFDSSTTASRTASAAALAYALSRSNFLGLFGISSGKIANITLDNVTVTGMDASSSVQVGSYEYLYGGSGAVGSLVGMNKGTITNAHTTSIDGASTVKTDYGAGGLVGVELGGTIASSDAAAAVTADGDGAGGLVGANFDGTITASTASGDVATSNSIAGGLAGLNTGTIKSSTASGDVSGTAYLGGLVGINATDAAVSKGLKLAAQTGDTLANLLGSIGSLLPSIVRGNGTGTGTIGAGSWATGDVAVANGGHSVGGLVGVNFGTMDSLSSTSPTGAISTTGSVSTIGGMVGENYGKISNSSVTGVDIDQGSGYIDDLGGLVSYNGGTLLNTYASGTLTGNAWVGGLAAENDGSITGSHFSGTVNGADIVGGLVGYSGGTGTITKSYAEGSVSATGTVHVVANYDGGDSDNNQINRAGGLVGVNDGKISLSYATGDVTADSNDTSGTTTQDSVSEVGGLVADNSGTITQSYARNASLTINSNGTNANGWIGGLVGDNGGTISQSYAYTGSMSGGYGTLSSLRGNGGLPMSLTNPGQGQGGLVGVNWGDSAKSKASVATSFWNTDATSDTTGTVSQGIGVNSPDGFSVNDLSIAQGGTQTAVAKVKSKGLTTAGFDVASNFTASGWAVDTVGGGSQAWRLYTDDTTDGAPLLKAFLTKLTVTPTAGSKVYDGTTAATYSGSAVPQYVYSLANADTSQIQGLNTSITLTNKNAGKYAVTGSGLLYSDQKGYDLIFKSGTYTVSKAALTIGGVSVVSKAYNGNTVAQLDNTDAALSGVVSIDQSNPMLLSLVSTKATGTFASKNAGTGIAVTAKGYTISGADAANYTLTQPTGLTGDITQ